MKTLITILAMAFASLTNASTVIVGYTNFAVKNANNNFLAQQSINSSAAGATLIMNNNNGAAAGYVLQVNGNPLGQIFSDISGIMDFYGGSGSNVHFLNFAANGSGTFYASQKLVNSAGNISFQLQPGASAFDKIEFLDSAGTTGAGIFHSDATGSLEFWTGGNQGGLNPHIYFTAAGGIGVNTSSEPGVGLIYLNSASFLMRNKTSWTNGAAAGAGTLTNAPAAGNPTKWVPIDDNGVTRYIPTW